MRRLLPLVLGLFSSFAALAAAPSFSGAGSSAAAPIYQNWSAGFQKSGGAALTYEPIGSSAGLKKVRTREVEFGASDVAPSAAELQADGLVLVPLAITGITPVINVPKVGDQALKLSGDVLARIFLGELTQWNAPEIVALNPALGLPALPIKVIVRSDGSGTTYNFADYLAKVHPNWKERMGVKTTLTWPKEFIGAKGSGGVVKAVKETVGAIGYVDYGYTQDNRLTTIQVKNLEGDFVRPSALAFRAALVNSDWSDKGIFTGTLTQRPGKTSWPITMGTFVLLPQVTDTMDRTEAAVAFFTWALLSGDSSVKENNFVRLPDRVKALAFKSLASIRDRSGKLVPIRLD